MAAKSEKMKVDTIAPPDDDFCDISYNSETDSVVLNLESDADTSRIQYDSEDCVICMMGDQILHTDDAKIAVDILNTILGKNKLGLTHYDVKDILDTKKQIDEFTQDKACSTADDFVSEVDLMKIIDSEEGQENFTLKNEDGGNVEELLNCIGYIKSTEEAVNENMINEYKALSKKSLQNAENKFRELLMKNKN